MRGIFLAALLFLQQQPAMVQPGATVTGRLMDSDRKPVLSTLLFLSPIPSPEPDAVASSYPAFTDETGAFVFRGVRSGTYFLSSSAGPSPIYYPGVATPTQRSRIEVADSSAINGLEFVLPPTSTARVSGRVVIPETQPVPVNRRIVQMFGGRPYRRLSGPIAQDGSFEIRNVTPGQYSLEVPAVPLIDGIEITVADRDVTGIELKMPAMAAVQGRVAFEGRAARSNVAFEFNGPMRKGLSGAGSRPDGTFSLQLVPGSYRTVVHNLPAGYYLKSLNSGSVDLLTRPLEVSLSSPPPGVVATLAPSAGVKISGHVKDSGPLPAIDNRRITLAGTATDTIVSAPVNDDGSFDVNKLLPGTYSARVALTSSVSSAPAIVSIPEKDVKDFDIPLPGLKEIFGRVAVDGNGPAPKFSFVLVRGLGLKSTPDSNDSKLPVVKSETLRALAESGAGQVMRIEVEPLTDGTFKMTLPEGDYRVVTVEEPYGPSAGFPVPFFLRSINYGSARLMTEPMVVSSAELAELHVGLGVSIPNPWAKVSGRVIGLNSSSGPVRVALNGNVLAPLETPVNPDGTFEFPMVLVNENYTASILPQRDAATEARISALKGDVKNVEIVIPPEREINVRASVEGGGAVPGFILRLQPTPCQYCPGMAVNVKPEGDGTARVKFPEDERKVFVDGLPIGYDVKSMTYGTKDLTKERLKLAGSETRDLEVKFEVDPKMPTGSVRGRVTGLDPEARYVQLVLHGIAFVSTFEAPVNADGSFSFSKIPQGTYTPTLTGDVVSGRLTPASIVITSRELLGVEIAAPRRNARVERPSAEPVPTGASIQELGVASSEDASYSAAVANLRTINTAEVTYLSASGGNYGTMKDLVDAGLLDSTFLNIKAGYSFNIVANGPDYHATAVPATSGRYGIYSTPDAVVRYSLAPVLSIRGQEGRPLQ